MVPVQAASKSICIVTLRTFFHVVALMDFRVVFVTVGLVVLEMLSIRGCCMRNCHLLRYNFTLLILSIDMPPPSLLALILAFGGMVRRKRAAATCMMQDATR